LTPTSAFEDAASNQITLLYRFHVQPLKQSVAGDPAAGHNVREANLEALHKFKQSNFVARDLVEALLKNGIPITA